MTAVAYADDVHSTNPDPLRIGSSPPSPIDPPLSAILEQPPNQSGQPSLPEHQTPDHANNPPSYLSSYLHGASSFRIGTFVVINQGHVGGDHPVHANSPSPHPRDIPNTSGLKYVPNPKASENVGDNPELELQKRELKLDHREDQISQRELHLQTRSLDLSRREALVRWGEAELEEKEKANRELLTQVSVLLRNVANRSWPSQQPDHSTKTGAIGDSLLAVFGQEYARGITHVLKTFALLQLSPGSNLYRPRQDPVLLIPDYNGLSKLTVDQLSEPLAIAVSGLVDALRTQRQRSGQPLTLATIRSCLFQSNLLEPHPESCASVAFTRVLKCRDGSEVARLLLDSQWIVDLIRSDNPRHVVDLATSLCTGKHRIDTSLASSHISPFTLESVTLVDLTALSFPHLMKPWFKLSRLVVSCSLVKKGSLMSKNRVFAIVEYRSQAFQPRHSFINSLGQDAGLKAREELDKMFP